MMNIEEIGRPIEILLVEDNPADVRLTIEVFKDARVHSHLSVVEDGVEALAFLRHEEKYAHAPRPDIVLLDLNLPKKDGLQVLAEIKEDENLKRIPVIILTTSQAEEDIIRTSDLHANCFITKPVALEEFIKVVESLKEFWLTVAKLPPE
jgi:two-component system, chemotaxis family, response regulator Rcp1